MKMHTFLCVSTLAVLISSVRSQCQGFNSPYELQGYGSDLGVVDPMMALRLKSMKKLNKLSLGCEQAVGRAQAIKSKCSKIFTQQLLKNKLSLQELNSPFNGFSDQLFNLNQGQIYNAQPSIISAAQLQGATPSCLQVATPPCASALNFQGAGLPNFQGSALPNFQGATLQNLPGSALSGLQASALSNFQASALPNFEASALPNFQASALPSFQGSTLPNLRGSALSALQSLQGSPFQNVQTCPLPDGPNPPVQIQNIQIPFEQIQRMSSEPMEFGTPIDHRIYNIGPNQNCGETFQQCGPQANFQQQLNPQSGPYLGGSQFEEFRPTGASEQFSPSQFQNGAMQFPNAGEYEERQQPFCG